MNTLPPGYINQTIAVDFDEVICQRPFSDLGDDTRTAVPGALPAVTSLMTRFPVFIHTARRPLSIVIDWMVYQGFRCRLDDGTVERWEEKGLLLITGRKLPARVYLDDRAVTFTSWPQALGDIDLIMERLGV